MFKQLLTFILVGCLATEPSTVTYLNELPELTDKVNSGSINNSTNDDTIEENSEPSTELKSCAEEETEDKNTDESIIEDGTDLKDNEEMEDTFSDERDIDEEINLLVEPIEKEAVAISSDISIAAPYGESNAIWYSFTAPKNGRYLFYTSGELSYENTDYTYVYLSYNQDNDYDRYAYFNDGNYLFLATDYMKTGDIVYLRIYSNNENGKTFTLKFANETVLAGDGNGNYNAILKDADSIFIRQKVGYRCLNVDAEIVNTSNQWSYHNYYLYIGYLEKNSYYYNCNSYISLYSDSYNAADKLTIRVDSDAVYELCYIVRNDNGEIEAFLTGADPLTTESTDEGVYIHDYQCMDYSIIMNIEPVCESYMYCYYAPADGSDEERKYDEAIHEWKDYTFDDLKAGTEYVFRFCDYYGTMEYGRKTYVTTGNKVLVTSVSYGAEISADFTTLQLSATVDNYTGSSNTTYFYYQYKDALGVERKGYQVCSINKSEDAFSLIADIKNVAFLADSDYDIMMWLFFPDDYLTLLEDTCKITTPQALYHEADIAFACQPNEASANLADYTITVAGSGNMPNGTLFYKPENGMPDYKSISITPDTLYGNITSLISGNIYECMLFMGGVKKTAFVKTQSFSKVYLEQAADYKNEIGAYDIVRTLQIKTDDMDALSDVYYLHLYYAVNGSYELMGYDTVELRADNNYRVTVYSADWFYGWLCPDTDYYLKWTITQYEGSESDHICTLYEKIHTKPAEITLCEKESYCDKQTYMITLEKEEIVNMAAYDKSLYLEAYIKKSDEKELCYKEAGWCSLTSENGYSALIELMGLTAATSYDLSIRDSEGNIYKEIVFSTPEDERILEITSIKCKVTVASIYYSISGTKEDYLLCYIRKKGDEEWKLKDYKYFSSADIYPFYISDLSEKCTYEYAIGFGSSYDTPADKLEKAVIDEFTTQGDERILSENEVIRNSGITVLKAFFSGNIDNVTSYIHFFYKKTENEDWIKVKEVIGVTAVSQNCSVVIDGLERDTDYDYAIVLSDTNVCENPEIVTKEAWKLIGDFATKAAVAHESITLSHKELSLNIAYKNTEGCGKQTIKVVWEPYNAAKGLIWSSSNPNVAVVEEGVVSAVGVGTAQISVTSPYIKEDGSYASAVCDVVVGNYQIGYEESGIQYLFSENEKLKLYKESNVSGYKLYRVGDSSMPEAVSDFRVESGNAQIVSYQNGIITAQKVGSTKLIFTAEDETHVYLPVEVYARGKGFTITDFVPEHGYSEYPAIMDENDNTHYTLAYVSGIAYRAIGEISPFNEFRAEDFAWKITDMAGNDTSIAEVNPDNGTILPIKEGKIRLRVTLINNTTLYYEKEKTWILDFKALPNAALESNTSIYALADISNKISDIEFPDKEIWRDWVWKYPDMPLVTNGMNKEAYPFVAVYEGKDYYPCETTIATYISKVTGVSVEDDHNGVIEVGINQKNVNTVDAMILTVTLGYQGTLKASAYNDYSVALPEINGLKIEPFASDNGDTGIYTYKITAQKRGNYTIKPCISVMDKNGKKKVLAKTSYKIKAVDDAQAKCIILTSGTENITIERTDTIAERIVMNASSDVKSFILNADVIDRNDIKIENTKLVWKTSDKTVASLKVSQDTRSAEIIIKGSGHTMLTVAAKDARGCMTTMRIEIQNHAPRVDRSKVTVNRAYDYGNSDGHALAARASGVVEIIPVYDEPVTSVGIYENEEISSEFKVYDYSNNKWVIGSETLPPIGTYNCNLHVTTTAGDYHYPLEISVIESKAKIKVKAANSVNLFYTCDNAVMDLFISDTNSGIQDVIWRDNSNLDGIGFDYYSRENVNDGIKRLYFKQGAIRISNGKLINPDIVKGTLIVKLYGYKESYNLNNVTIKWNYKKPSIITKASVTTLIPNVQKNSNTFTLYNKTDKKTLSYNANSTDVYSYNKLLCDNEYISLFETGDRVAYLYSGSKRDGSEKIKLTLMSDTWREFVDVYHTIKIIKPTAYLTAPTITMNMDRVGTARTYIKLKKANNDDPELKCADIVIEGKNPKSEKLLDDDLLEITYNKTDASRINVKLNRIEDISNTMKSGSYTYKVTPYYINDSGERAALKTLTLKVKLINKAITAKTKTIGNLDLTNGNSFIALSPVFNNIGNEYTVTDIRLLGEYSDYFEFSHTPFASGYGILKMADYSKLKSGQKYRLMLEYTIEMQDGDKFIVIGSTFTVKPKQTNPKISINNNNQIMYAAANNVNRYYYLSLTEPYYTIENVSGGLDCNKDGIEDIRVSGTSGNSYSTLTVKISDKDGAITNSSAKGKTYNIPITVGLRGRDGISKDIVMSIKVIVKR